MKRQAFNTSLGSIHCSSPHKQQPIMLTPAVGYMSLLVREVCWSAGLHLSYGFSFSCSQHVQSLHLNTGVCSRAVRSIRALPLNEQILVLQLAEDNRTNQNSSLLRQEHPLSWAEMRNAQHLANKIKWNGKPTALHVIRLRFKTQTQI